ncbi:MAG: DUF1828 domain-containing protein [Burkholderiaceae bacterium]|nr:MAG: DUF1828 domain-containing protein [Burkholderiaceae bacterium]
MNCTEFLETLGLSCKILPSFDGKPIHCISTPFEYFDGDGIHLYAEELGGLMRFFDAGDTLFHVSGSGIKLRDKRAIKPIQKLVEEAGAQISDEGEISILSPLQDGREGFRKALTAILNIAGWEAENAGISNDVTSLASEVEIYLREWKAGYEFLYEQPLAGISGRSHSFSFLVDGELIDVVSSAPQSTASEVRKLADIRGIPSQSDTPIRVIIDDRSNPERARQEALILSRFADIWPLTSLQATVEKMGSAQH